MGMKRKEKKRFRAEVKPNSEGHITQAGWGQRQVLLNKTKKREGAERGRKEGEAIEYHENTIGQPTRKLAASSRTRRPKRNENIVEEKRGGAGERP